MTYLYFPRPALTASLALSLLFPALAHAQAPTPPPDAATAPLKIKINKLSDLPPRTYAISGKASDLVQDPQKVQALAAQVKTDTLADLAKYDIGDAATLREFYGTLARIALLQKSYPEALMYLAKVRDLQDKPAARLSSGLATGALIAALQDPGPDFHATLRAQLGRALSSVPYAPVQDTFKEAKAQYEILSANLVLGQIAAEVDPLAQSGQMSRDVAAGLINDAATLQYIVPNQADFLAAYTDVVAAHKTAQKPDIWKARAVSLAPSAKLTPIVVGIWDSGTDIRLYKSQLWTNPQAGRDGYVGDVHGIAWTLHSDPSPTLLLPLSRAEVRQYEPYLVGFEDLQANIDSPDAAAVRAKLSTLPQDQVKGFLEGIGAFSDYAHGTHVTGIAVRGNPAARVLVCRITFDPRLIPETPTVAQALKDAAAADKQVAYFKAHGVRVVNMSWGGDLASVEDALEKNRAGGTPEQRKRLARRIFDIGYKRLYAAMKNAPGILFVPAEGNADSDVNFIEDMPSSYKLPNIIVAGAVDQAGDQTSFTSFGNVDVYSNGFQVPSFIPGGRIVPFSGTSMSAPQVTNLAAKLLALHPALMPVQVKALILRGSDRKVVNGKTLLLINPKKTLALAASHT